MPVVINEFEIVAEPPPQKAGGEPGASVQSGSGGKQATGPTTHDIMSSLRHQKERLARVRAC